jgi:hypothetical protein
MSFQTIYFINYGVTLHHALLHESLGYNFVSIIDFFNYKIRP